MNAPAGIEKSTTLSKQKLRTWLSLIKTQKFIEAQVRELLREEFSTTLPRFDVLAMLYRSPQGLKMSELSQQLMVSNGNVTGIIERLVEDKQVTRTTVDEDRRATQVRLTAAGRKSFQKMATRHEQLIDEILSGLTMKELNATISTLQKIRGEH